MKSILLVLGLCLWASGCTHLAKKQTGYEADGQKKPLEFERCGDRGQPNACEIFKHAFRILDVQGPTRLRAVRSISATRKRCCYYWQDWAGNNRISCRPYPKRVPCPAGTHPRP